MNLLKDFSDLEKANKYISTINQAFAAEAEAKKAAMDQSKLLQKSLDEQTENSEKLKGERDKALETITELSQKLDVHESSPGEGIIVTIGKETRRLIGEVFLYDGQKRTAKELAQDQKQLAKMLKSDSGSLVAVK